MMILIIHSMHEMSNHLDVLIGAINIYGCFYAWPADPRMRQALGAVAMSGHVSKAWEG